jgi:ABC-2 type transport system ATP-binding protein
MDEPTQGLDPEGAREFLQLVQSLKEEGITILLSSHLLHQVQAICDRVGLFNRGRMELVGTVDELARKVLGRAYRVIVEVDEITPELTETLKAVPGAVDVHPLEGNRLAVEAAGEIRHEVAQAIVQSGRRLLGLYMEAQNLDEIYAHYFKEVEHGAR